MAPHRATRVALSKARGMRRCKYQRVPTRLSRPITTRQPSRHTDQLDNEHRNADKHAISTATSTATSIATSTAISTATSTATSTRQRQRRRRTRSVRAGRCTVRQGTQNGVAVSLNGSLSLIPAISDDFTGTSLNSAVWNTSQWRPVAPRRQCGNVTVNAAVSKRPNPSPSAPSRHAPNSLRSTRVSEYWLVTGSQLPVDPHREPGSDPSHVYAASITDRVSSWFNSPSVSAVTTPTGSPGREPG